MTTGKTIALTTWTFVGKVMSVLCNMLAHNKCKVNESQYCFSSIRTTEKTERQRIDAFELWVLEKTLESPLDCKEIQPVHPKRNQSRVFIGRTDVEAETPILWPPDAKT